MNRRMVIGLLAMALVACTPAQPKSTPDQGNALPSAVPPNPPPSTVPTEQSATVIATSAPAATHDLADLIWQDGDLAGFTATPITPINGTPNPLAYGVQLMQGDQTVGAIAGMTLSSTAAAQAQLEEIQKSGLVLGATATKINDLGDLAYSIDGESAQFILSRCNIIVQFFFPSSLSAERIPLARKIDERLKIACAGAS